MHVFLMVEYINDEIKMYVIRKYTTLGSKLDLIIDGELQDLSQFDELPCKAKTTHTTVCTSPSGLHNPH